RRAISITGLKNATVILFSEKDRECAVSIAQTTDETPQFDPRFKIVNDKTYGKYLKGENISENIYFLIGHKNS
ncbi:MAG: hypothetical protein IJZ89_04160, partial [Clostridia bacterium]|nr:hypothetical protein [Clostridia bacterium]